MNLSLDFAPHIATWALWLFVAASVALAAYAFAMRATGAWARALALAVLLLALANPLIVHETREPLPDVAAIIVDHTQSMEINNRRAEADTAAAAIRKKLGADKSLEIREAFVDTRSGEDTGTQLFAAINNAFSDVPPDRLAGAIAITDGEVHDAPQTNKPALSAPIQALIVGKHNERDRKLTIISATRYAIVGQQADVVLRVDDFGGAGEGTANVDIHVDGVAAGSRVVPVGKQTDIKLQVAHAGENVVELDARAGPAELTLQNNRAVISVNGVRDRLRVLLISGEPHAGERVWRSLLKADPAVDLVHFTILRPPYKQDATPIDELSLIVFPAPLLFEHKLNTFDLIIFDRYTERGILPLGYYENIENYVRNGGALLVSSGPEFAGPFSIYHTPLESLLPAQPTGDIIAQPFKPLVTAQGLAHPVTRALPGGNTARNPTPTWGKWFRTIGANVVAGETVMSGANGKPLLVLDQQGKGRVAELLSDHIWLWARGYDGGGPDAELLRRLAHWLMKEPELEEERLSASITEGQIAIERRTMKDNAVPVSVTYPSGKHATVALTKSEPGLWKGGAKADELGLYRLSDGTLNAVAASGPLNPKEVADMRATDSILNDPVRATGGSVHWLEDGMPDIRHVSSGATAYGSNWIGLRTNSAYRVTSVEQMPLLPAWLAFILLIGTLMLAWRQEGR
ncbi:MAG TPA: hypothetical protein VG309_08615 [Rhizomicrobium sp.]|nr:hypothetical protein [Rhizomicrobium sp.]